MRPRPTRSTRTDTLCPYTTRVRSAPLQRSIPARAAMGQQREKRRRQVLLQLPQRQFAAAVGVLQVEVHRVTGQCGILHAPRLRRLPQEQVGPGAHVEPRKARVDTLGIGTQCGCRSEEHTSELQSLMRISYAV